LEEKVRRYIPNMMSTLIHVGELIRNCWHWLWHTTTNNWSWLVQCCNSWLAAWLAGLRRRPSRTRLLTNGSAHRMIEGSGWSEGQWHESPVIETRKNGFNFSDEERTRERDFSRAARQGDLASWSRQAGCSAGRRRRQAEAAGRSRAFGTYAGWSVGVAQLLTLCSPLAILCAFRKLVADSFNYSSTDLGTAIRYCPL